MVKIDERKETLREKGPNTESVFSDTGNTDQKKLITWTLLTQ